MTHHLVGLTEIAAMLGVSKQRADQLSRKPDFPPPVANLSSGRVWETRSIQAWARRAGRQTD